MPNFNREYTNKIEARIAKNASRLTLQKEAIAKARVIPDEEDQDIGKGKHLSLAVLFLDICAFSSWPQGSEAEQSDVLSIFNIFMAEMMRIAEDYGGAVEKNTGDGLMAYFAGEGETQAAEACKTAIQAACTMFYAAEQLINPVLARDGFRKVDFRIGIDYGPVTIAVVGGKRVFKSQVAIGTTAVIANRILRDCGKNELVVGDLVYKNLPADWQQWCAFLKSATGFIYTRDNSAYSYWKYNGRWGTPK